MSECPLCEESVPGEEMFDHVSDHDRHEVVAWVVNQAD